ncbi:beta-phosphoglucomutase [Geitlerinema splendidum]|nr:beta-phosphoglucomutase [Geitlerinema splendidum]
MLYSLDRPANNPQDSTDYVGWNVVETELNPSRLHSQETVFTLGNGYLGTRGSFEEGYPGDCAVTLIHGVYDDVPVVYTELANCPNWLPLQIKVGESEFRLDLGEILAYERRLDLRLGLLSRDVRWRSPEGHTLIFHFERFASLADRHVLALRVSVTAVDYQGAIEVTCGFDDQPHNQGVFHWQTLAWGGSHSTLELQSKTLASGIELGMVAHLAVLGSDRPVQLSPDGQHLQCCFDLKPGQQVTLEKTVTLFTSRETPTPLADARDRLNREPCYSTLLAAHIAAWAEVWQQCDVVIEGDLQAQLSVRYNLFQLLVVAPRQDDRVSIPAKTLSGFAYRGHVFWDTEIFIVPFLTLTQPALAKNLLNYRYNTLPGARRKAQEAGYEGAMYAWESATTGDEVTPRWVTGKDGEAIRIWCGDIEVHITSDVAYAVWHYWQMTGDDRWMRDRGAEMILDTAVFWGSRVVWNAERQSYEILDVIGPDENHDRVDNNAFTNVMAQWHLQKALTLWDWLKRAYPETATQLQQQLGLTPERLQQWVNIAQNLRVVQDVQTGLIEQFDGFFQLEDINWADYESRTTSLQGLLGIEATSQRQILKQADVLMLLYLLRERYSPEVVQANWDYYTPRTDHAYGSSLGPAVHAILACDLNSPAEAYTHFMRAALVDLEDVRGNAAEGIHAASAGGVWQAAIFGFGGVRLTQFGPVACPSLPPGWTRLKFRLQWHNQRYEFDIRPENVQVSVVPVSLESHLLPIEPSVSQDLALKGAIFDLDGVITDTAHYHYLAWKQLADEEGIPFDEQANEAMRGLPRRESLLRILGDRTVSEAQMQEMMERKNRYYVDLLDNVSSADLLPGVAALLDELRSMGVKISLGSSSKNARMVLERLGIAECFDAIADGYSVSQPKPAPDLFQFAAQQLGLSPEECVVFEDAEAGIEGALAAGMWAVGLGPVQRVGKAHLVLSTLEGKRWVALKRQMAQPVAV